VIAGFEDANRDVSSEQFNKLRRDITRQLTSQIVASSPKVGVTND